MNACLSAPRLAKGWTGWRGGALICSTWCVTAPYVLKRGSTVLDAARHVHKDFAERLKLARLYRRDRLEEGLPVSRDHIVEDGDILEFHA
jgi:ribosome-interacting GTPase 1